MPVLFWDKVGDRRYETGLDKCVLYLPDGSAVPWNGLTSVIEHFDRNTSPVYYDGMKISDLVVLGDFSASMKAITYPDEFIEIEGSSKLRPGFFVSDQKPKTFGLCYRTHVGDDLAGDTSSYKIHIVYNITAIPKDKVNASKSINPSLVEFEWDLVAVPVNCPKMRPTAHIVIDSRDFDPWLLEDLEKMLYGSPLNSASLIPMCDLINYIATWCRLQIIDNGDGTWTAISARDELIDFDEIIEGLFTIIDAVVIDLEDGAYIISSACDISDIPLIKIIDNGDGTWTAITGEDILFSVDEDNFFQINNANFVMVAEDIYQLSDTVE